MARTLIGFYDGNKIPDELKERRGIKVSSEIFETGRYPTLVISGNVLVERVDGNWHIDKVIVEGSLVAAHVED